MIFVKPIDKEQSNDVYSFASSYSLAFINVHLLQQPMSRLYFHGPRFRYQVRWRVKGTFTWDSAYVIDPSQGFLNVETNDVYTAYELQVKAENSMGEAHQPAFIFVGQSGESGKAEGSICLPVCLSGLSVRLSVYLSCCLNLSILKPVCRYVHLSYLLPTPLFQKMNLEGPKRFSS